MFAYVNVGHLKVKGLTFKVDYIRLINHEPASAKPVYYFMKNALITCAAVSLSSSSYSTVRNH